MENDSESKKQYQADIDGLAGVPDNNWAEADEHDGGAPLGLHDTTLFDQDETLLGGDLIDPATGNKIDNSTDRLLGLVTLPEPGSISFDSDDVLFDALVDDSGELDIEWYFHVQTEREQGSATPIEDPEAK